MKGFKLTVFGYFFDGLTQYFVEPIARIFGPSDDNYPATGLQPFEGEPLAQRVEVF
jgi:hypothetical protein